MKDITDKKIKRQPENGIDVMKGKSVSYKQEYDINLGRLNYMENKHKMVKL